MKTISIEREFSEDHITRAAGERLRNRIVEAFTSEKKIVVDFSNVVIASTSFLDEGLAKLADEGWSAEMFSRRIELRGMHSGDVALLKQLTRDRSWTF